MSAIASHYLGRPATPPIALSLEPAGDVLGSPARLSEEIAKLSPTERRVLEDVFVSEARQTIYFLGRPRMLEEGGEVLMASPFQPLFHVRHGVGGSQEAPLNLWSTSS